MQVSKVWEIVYTRNGVTVVSETHTSETTAYSRAATLGKQNPVGVYTVRSRTHVKD